MRTFNLTLAFLLEIIAFFAFAAVGFLLPTTTLLQILCSVGTFGLLISFWGVFMSPKASKKLRLTHYYVVKFIIYAVATFVLYRLVGQTEALLFFIVALLNDCLLFTHNKRNER